MEALSPNLQSLPSFGDFRKTEEEDAANVEEEEESPRGARARFNNSNESLVRREVMVE